MNGAIDNVVGQIGDGDHGTLIKERASQHGFCSSNQLNRLEGFGNIIVCAVVEGASDVDRIVLCRQYHDGWSRLLLP